MRPIATYVSRSVICVSVCWAHKWASQNGWTDRYAVWELTEMGPDPPWEVAHLRGICACPLWRTYAWVHCARCERMCLPSTSSGRMHSLPRDVTKRRCGLLPITLDTYYFYYFRLPPANQWYIYTTKTLSLGTTPRTVSAPRPMHTKQGPPKG